MFGVDLVVEEREAGEAAVAGTPQHTSFPLAPQSSSLSCDEPKPGSNLQPWTMSQALESKSEFSLSYMTSF